MAKAHAQHIGTVVFSIVNTLNNGSHIARTIALQYGHGHDVSHGIGTRHTNSVVTHSGGNARAVSAMAVKVQILAQARSRQIKVNVFFIAFFC